MPPITGVAPAYANFPELSSGAKGESVSNIQDLLNQAGAKIEVDGDWGPKTDQAVRDFQRQSGLKVDGIIGPKTMTALTEASNGKGTTSLGSPVSKTGHFNLDEELASPDSRLSVAIGHAENTRNVDGTPTRHFNHHVDPGNSKDNYGTFSKQNGPTSPKEADQAQLREFRNFRPQYEKACRAAGLDPSDPLLAASTFDLYNQAPAAVKDKGGFLDQFPMLAKQGVTPENIIKARVQSFYNPDTKTYQVADVLKGPGALRHDQERRTSCLRDVIERPADSHAPSVHKAERQSPAKTGTTAKSEGPAPAKNEAPIGAGPKIALNSKGPEVVELKQALKAAGFYNGPINDTMGNQGIEALKLAKETIGIGGDPRVAGPETVKALSDHAKSTNLHVEVAFTSQFDPVVPGDPGDDDPNHKCDNACEYMMKNNPNVAHRVMPGTSKEAERAFTGGGAADPQTHYIESQLRSGKPVMIGVNRPKGNQHSSNTNGANHYLVATGMHTDEKGRRYITFNDPAWKKESGALGKDTTNPNNRLYLQNGQFEQTSGSDPYQLRCVVQNQPDKKAKA